MRLFRQLFVSLTVLVLGACRYEATGNLHSGYTEYQAHQFFGKGDKVFLNQSAGEFVFAKVSNAQAKLQISKLAVNDTIFTASISSIVKPRELPKGYYIAVQRTASGKHHYYPFYYTKSAFNWIRPAGVKKVSSRANLISEINKTIKKSVKKFALLDPSASSRARSKLASVKAEKAALAAANKKKVPTNVPSSSSSIPTGINALDVGDGVYVEGLFSDELAVIVRIDQASGNVKVRRQSDGTTVWVPASKVISREQSTANDFARGAVAVGVVACILNPDACKKK